MSGRELGGYGSEQDRPLDSAPVTLRGERHETTNFTLNCLITVVINSIGGEIERG